MSVSLLLMDACERKPKLYSLYQMFVSLIDLKLLEIQQ